MEPVKSESYGQEYGGSIQQNYPPPSYAQLPSMRPSENSSMPSDLTVSVPPQEPLFAYDASSTSPTALDTGAIIFALATLCLCLPIGIAAIVASGYAYEKRSGGKHDTANKLSKMSIILSIYGPLSGIILIVVLVVVFKITKQ
ncbi:uncharacterized protein [Ptychodera flava]|uniref:uncharacterized protein n=1 Tax=Ptychodera flava TaxID=63121 RepID=UPI00396A24AB